MTAPATESGRPPGERRCVDCGGVLSPSPVVPCRSLACLASGPAAADARRRSRRRELALEALEAAGLDPARTPWSLVPFQGAPQVPVPPDQRADFVDHLRRVAARVDEVTGAGAETAPKTVPAGGSAEAGTEPKTVSTGRGTSRGFDESVAGRGGGAEVQPSESVPTAVLEAACAQCRGWCCRKGRRHHAFLDAETLAGVRERRGAAVGDPEEPPLGPDEVVALYASFIGETHVAGSCVLHGPDGCRLPRAMRSKTCNEFFCPPLAILREGRANHSGPSSARAFVAVSAEPGREPRLGSLAVVVTESPPGSVSGVDTESPLGSVRSEGRESPPESVTAAASESSPEA